MVSRAAGLKTGDLYGSWKFVLGLLVVLVAQRAGSLQILTVIPIVRAISGRLARCIVINRPVAARRECPADAVSRKNNPVVELAMRRTTICLAVVVLLLGGPAWAQEVLPGEPMPPVEPGGPEAVPGGPASGEAGQASGQASPEPSGQPPPQKWQPLEEIIPMPDVTTSNTTPPVGATPMTSMVGPLMEARPRGPCCEKTGRGYWCPPNWSVDQRVRVMHHPKPRGTITGQFGSVGIGYDFITEQYVESFALRDGMSTRSTPLEPSAAYEITIARYLGRDSDNRDHFLEFVYYGPHDWDQTYAIHRTERPTITNGDLWPNQEQIPLGTDVTFGNLFSFLDNDLTGFNRADDLSERYASRMDNFELNMRVRPRPRIDRMMLYQNGRWRREAQEGCLCSFLLGMRGISLDEDYLLVGTGLNVVDDVTTSTSGRYDVRTHNDMVGLQIGGDVVWRKGFAELGMRAKGGVFVNFADQYTTLVSTGGLGDPMANQELYDVNGPYTDTNDQYSEDRLARSRDVGGVAEFGFTAGYQVRRNMVVRAAYDIMWLSGVALAPEQVNGQIGAPGRINRNGLLFMQSLSLGVELDW